MLGFWLAASLLLLTAMLVTGIALLRPYKKQQNLLNHYAAICQQRMEEVEADITNGLINKTEADNLKKQIRSELLQQDKKNSDTSELQTTSATSAKATVIILILLVPVFVISMYQYLGQPGYIKQIELLSAINQAETREAKIASVEKLLKQLEQRMLNEPDNVAGWLMLANSYTALERYPDAVRAVDNLYRLRRDDPTVMLRYADILSMANGGIFAGKPTELINRAIQLTPENPNGLWLAGLAANERGDIDSAIRYWTRLLPKLEQGTRPQQQIKDYIRLAGTDPGTSESNDITQATSSISLQINVRLSEELRAQTNSNDTVFIYATAMQGSPVPLAIVRKKIADLPIQVSLDDSLAVIPDNKLSNHNQVRLIARVSKTGNAKPQAGDLMGTVDSIKTTTTEPLNLLINQQIQ